MLAFRTVKIKVSNLMSIDEKILDKIFQMVHYDPVGFILDLQKEITPEILFM